MSTANGVLPEARRSHPTSAVAVDPLARVLATGPRLPISLVIALAIMLHGGAAAGATMAALFGEIVAWNHALKEAIAARLAQSYEVEVENKPPPPPPPPVEEEAKPVVKEVTPPPTPKDTPPPPPPAAAEAAKVLTQEPTPNEPVDLTGNSFVTGSGSTYAGGTTQAGGTSKTAVYNPLAAAGGKPGGTGTAPSNGPVGEDKSRTAGLLGSTDWSDCPFPPEADAEQIDQQSVLVQVTVRADGSPESVTIVQDPGHGFGRQARMCAMRKKYATALDRSGTSIGGQTKPFRVRFER